MKKALVSIGGFVIK